MAGHLEEDLHDHEDAERHTSKGNDDLSPKSDTSEVKKAKAQAREKVHHELLVLKNALAGKDKMGSRRPSVEL